MALPQKLKYFNMFFDGDNFFGQIPEVTTPKLTKKMEAYRAGGMPGSVSVDLGFDDGALDMEVTTGGLNTTLMKKWAVTTADGMQVRFSGSYQDEQTGEAVPCEIQTRGRFTEFDGGSAKAGDDTSHKFTLKNTYCKITVRGEEIFELDVINMIYKIDGVDILAQHRANIGL